MVKANFDSMHFMQDFIRWLDHFVGGGMEVVGLLTFGGGAGVWCKIESLQTVDLHARGWHLCLLCWTTVIILILIYTWITRWTKAHELITELGLKKDDITQVVEDSPIALR